MAPPIRSDPLLHLLPFLDDNDDPAANTYSALTLAAGRAGPVVLAGGAAALGPHMAGGPESCMYGGGEKPLGSAVSSGNGIAGAREPACSIPHDGHVHAELLMGRA